MEHKIFHFTAEITVFLMDAEARSGSDTFVRTVVIRRGQSITIPPGSSIKPGVGCHQVTVIVAEESQARGFDIKEKRILSRRPYKVLETSLVWMPQRFRKATFQVAIPVGKRIQYGPEPRLA
jgi:hypothetical protein